MKDFKTWQSIISSLAISFVPAFVIYFVEIIFKKNVSYSSEFLSTSISYILSFVIIFLILKYIEIIPCFRKYRCFEGIWIQVIENSDRPISICKLKYDRDGYHFYGLNFCKEGTKPVKFTSTKFVADSDDSFYFITESNQKFRPEGFAKIYSIFKSDGGYYEGNGYYFDVTSAENSNVKYMQLFKFNKNFCSNELHLSLAIKINKLTPKEIYNYVIEYAKATYSINM